MSGPRAIEFDLTVEDSVAYTTHLMRTRQNYRRQRLLTKFFMPLILALVGIAWTSFSYHHLPAPNPWAFVFYFAFVVAYTLYIWLWYEAISRRRLTKMFSKGRNLTLFGWTRFELRDDAIWRASKLSEGWIRWEGVESVESDADNIYISLTSNTAYVIPRRAFADDATFKAFFSCADKLWRSAQAV